MVAIHSANSRALGMVADRNTKRAALDIMMMLSSHTTPLSLSLSGNRCKVAFLYVYQHDAPLNDPNMPAQCVSQQTAALNSLWCVLIFG